MEAVYRRLSALYKSGQTQAVTQVRGGLSGFSKADA